MDSGNAELPSPGFRGLSAGFQAGTVAVLVMLGWLGVSAQWYYHTLWTAPNIAASTFYGDTAVRAEFTYRTLSGLALYVVVYSLLGAAFGWSLRNYHNRLRIILFGILLALAWYYLWWAWLWRHINPLVMLYTHDRPMVVAHLLYGLWLGRFPRYFDLSKKREVAVPAAAAASEEAEQ